jgi:hypothetical protein
MYETVIYFGGDEILGGRGMACFKAFSPFLRRV